jgi:hypothetical protein
VQMVTGTDHTQPIGVSPRGQWEFWQVMYSSCCNSPYQHLWPEA